MEFDQGIPYCVQMSCVNPLPIETKVNKPKENNMNFFGHDYFNDDHTGK